MRLKYFGRDYFPGNRSRSPIITTVTEAYLCLPALQATAQTHLPSNQPRIVLMRLEPEAK